MQKLFFSLLVSLFVTSAFAGVFDTDFSVSPDQCADNVHALESSCTLGITTEDYGKYLQCSGIISTTANISKTPTVPRYEMIGIATRIRHVRIPSDYTCENLYGDMTPTLPSWACTVIERASQSGIISPERPFGRPLAATTRAEAYSMLMNSVCIAISPEPIEDFNADASVAPWEKKVIRAAMRNGLTDRKETNFSPDRVITSDEAYALSARIVEFARLNPTCPPVTPELVCK